MATHLYPSVVKTPQGYEGYVSVAERHKHGESLSFTEWSKIIRLDTITAYNDAKRLCKDITDRNSGVKFYTH